MAQYLKDAVRERIATAAVDEFARAGVRKATMAAIAKAAGVSTGNIYRYFSTKDDLFDAVVTDEFVGRFTQLIRRRIKALHGTADLREPAAAAAYAAASEALFAFAIQDRRRLVVLLARTEGTRLEGFSDRFVADLTRQALSYARSVRPGFEAMPALRFSLDQIYRNWTRTLVAILERFDTEAALRDVVTTFSSYHLAGLRGLLT
jgi:AcrR family transcriptional regulator